MLIKSVTKKGDAIAMSPEECLEAALIRAAEAESDGEYINWVVKGSLKPSSFNFHYTDKAKNQWEANSEGTVEIGRTEVASDRFFVARKINYKVQYNSVKDELGQHDIEVSSYELTNPQSQNDIMSKVVDNVTKPVTKSVATDKAPVETKSK